MRLRKRKTITCTYCGQPIAPTLQAIRLDFPAQSHHACRVLWTENNAHQIKTDANPDEPGHWGSCHCDSCLGIG